MKINKLNESATAAMRFKVFGENEYVNKPTVFLISVGKDAVIELSLDQITAVLNANGYGKPLWEVKSERNGI